MALSPPGPIARLALQRAIDNVGVKEDRKNGRWTNWGKWIQVYLAAVGIKDPAPWCLAFAEYRLIAAAKELGKELPEDFPITGYCPTLANWARKKGLALSVELAQPGDIILYWFPSLGRYAHAGIVRGIKNGYLHTVEGNTNDDGSRDGYAVCMKVRDLDGLGRAMVVRLAI